MRKCGEIAAGHQTEGRGRLGRTWTDVPDAAQLFSFILRPPLPPARTGLLSALIMQSEATRARAHVLARDQYLLGRVRTIDEIRAEIDGVTPDSIRDVLRFRADHPEARSPQIAEQLTLRLGSRCTPEWVRQILHRAREKFAELLLEEVIHSLHRPTVQRLEQELAGLGLFDYCRPALQRRHLAWTDQID